MAQWNRKSGGGIIGITKTSKALNRWALSYNLRSHIACETRAMYNLRLDDSIVHNEATTGQKTKDNTDENSIHYW